MKRQYHVLARHSGNLLKAVHRLGLCTDLSLAAAVVEAGEQPIDRSTIVRWRDGESCAPLGLLPVLLGHVDEPAAVLNILAEEHGLQVVPVGGIDTDPRGLVDRTLELSALTGELGSEVRSALSDGSADPAELQRIATAAAELARKATTLATLATDAAKLRSVG